jgi:hypothetical protein
MLHSLRCKSRMNSSSKFCKLWQVECYLLTRVWQCWPQWRRASNPEVPLPWRLRRSLPWSQTLHLHPYILLRRMVLIQIDNKTSRFRDRSRSPEYQPRRQSPNRRSPPHRRESPTYGVYDPNVGSDGNITHGNDRDRGRGRGRNRGRGRDRDEYRQRSPPVQRRQASPDAHDRRNSQPYS